jgi:hypothetical protein
MPVVNLDDVRPTRKKRQAPYNRERAMLHRRAKLGDETVDKLKGTSLDSAKEFKELIVLNRGAAPGELTDVVKQLVEDAIAGKPVSARVRAAEIGPTRYIKQSLLKAWNKRMIFIWEMAPSDEQSRLVEYLMNHMKPTGQ